jgi:hypothetical protein
VVARRGDTPPFGHRAVSLSRTVRPVAPIRASRPARGSPSGSRGSP